MDMGHFNLFIKMIAEEYKLSRSELEVLTSRLLADDREFEKIWLFYKKTKRHTSGVDNFRNILLDLIN
jgi:hypothetical protein